MLDRITHQVKGRLRR